MVGVTHRRRGCVAPSCRGRGGSAARPARVPSTPAAAPTPAAPAAGPPTPRPGLVGVRGGRARGSRTCSAAPPPRAHAGTPPSPIAPPPTAPPPPPALPPAMRSEHPNLARPPKRCLGALDTVSWPWIPVLGSLEPPRRDGENAPKTRKNGGELGEIWSKRCEGVGTTCCPSRIIIWGQLILG